MHLHIVFMLLYVHCVCVSLCRCSFVCVRHSIFYVCVTCCDLDVNINKSERRRERRTTSSRMYHQKRRRNEIRNLWLVCSLLPPTIYMYMDRPGLCLSLHYLHSSPPSLTQTYGLAKYTIRSFLFSLFSLLLHRF